MSEETENRVLPLHGIRIIDLTLALAGPLCTQRLADMGADVIKVEGPTRPDFTRNAPMLDIRRGGETIPYLSINRNKKSLALDLKTAEGVDILMRLAADADVVIQNMRPGVAERLGISFETLKAVNDKIVYVTISGYGDEGVMAGRPGQDLLVQAFSGMTFNAGGKKDLPQPAPIYIVDVAASHHACEAVLAGIIQRDRQAIPVHARVSLLEAVLEVQIQELTTFLTTGRIAQRTDAPYASTWMEPPYGIYATRDGYLAISQSNLEVVADVLEAPDLSAVFRRRPEPDAEEAMAVWRDEVHALMRSLLKDRERDDLVERLDAAKVWCGPVLNYEEFCAHPQAHDLFVEIDHPRAGRLKTLRPPIRFSTAPDAAPDPAPSLGQDGGEILGGLGLSAAEIDALRAKGVTL